MKSHRLSKPLSRLAITVLLFSPATAVLADDVEGEVEKIDAKTRSFVVNGEAFYVDDKTDYDDEYKRFEDVKEGDYVEIDYRDDNGRKLITEIEKETKIEGKKQK